MAKERGYSLSFSRHDSLALYHLMYNTVNNRLFLVRKKAIFERAIRTLWGRSSIG